MAHEQANGCVCSVGFGQELQEQDAAAQTATFKRLGLIPSNSTDTVTAIQCPVK